MRLLACAASDDKFDITDVSKGVLGDETLQGIDVMSLEQVTVLMKDTQW